VYLCSGYLLAACGDSPFCVGGGFAARATKANHKNFNELPQALPFDLAEDGLAAPAAFAGCAFQRVRGSRKKEGLRVVTDPQNERE